MHKLLKILLAIFISVFTISISFCQKAGKNSWIDTFSIDQPIFVSATKLNVVYYEIDNPMLFGAEGLTDKQIHVTSSAGQLIQTKEGYIFRISKKDTSSKLISFNIYRKEKDKLDFLCSKSFRTRMVPEPKAYFGRISNWDVNKAEVDLTNQIILKTEDFPFDLSLIVTRFQLIIIPENDFATSYLAESSILTAEMKAALSEIQYGDKILITNIWYKGIGDHQRHYKGSIELEVKI
jgi:hypothetical protein